MPLRQIIECPICRGIESKHHLTLDHRVISKCPKCSHTYAREFSTDKIESIYASDYHGSENNMDQWNTTHKNIWAGLCICISEYLKKENCSLLDIGAGTGGFAITIHELYPAVKLHLLETSLKAHPFIKQKLTASLYSNLSELSLKKNKFNIITLLQTLEHVEDPKLLCKSIYNLLDNCGVLLLTVPNRKSYQVYLKGTKETLCFGNQTHIHFFHKSAIKNFLLDCGFSKVVRVVQFGNGENKNLFFTVFQWAARAMGISTELRFLAFK